MVFLIAYAIFEVPSNYFLKKLRPSVRDHLIRMKFQVNKNRDGLRS